MTEVHQLCECHVPTCPSSICTYIPTAFAADDVFPPNLIALLMYTSFAVETRSCLHRVLIVTFFFSCTICSDILV